MLGNDAPSSPGLLPPCGFRNRVRTPVPKGRASQVWLDLLPERDYSVQMGGNCSALAILERQYCISHKNWDINSCHNSGKVLLVFFFSLLKFPHPEFTVGALIFILPPLQKSQTQLLLPCQYHLSVQPQPGVTVVKECAARLCLAKPELGLFWPLQTFKNGDILPPTPLS